MSEEHPILARRHERRVYTLLVTQDKRTRCEVTLEGSITAVLRYGNRLKALGLAERVDLYRASDSKLLASTSSVAAWGMDKEFREFRAWGDA